MAQKTLWTDEGSEVLEYLRKVRKLGDEAIRDFRLGWIPGRVRHDLAGRIILPLHDMYGDLVAITSRDHKPNAPLPHWHESFEKSFHLYGLDVALPYIIRHKKAIVVEGQFDTNYLHTIGLKMSVGILGSAMSFYHMCLLSRYCSEVFLLFDGDEGGRTATQRTMKIFNQQKLASAGLRYFPGQLSDNLDPDDLSFDQVLKYCKEARQRSIYN